MDELQKKRLEKYMEAVLAAPAHLHLTADREPKLFWNRHIMDAVALLGLVPPYYKEGAIRVLDIGSGNGIPGIPFSILMSNWSVDMLDSDNKKCGFLESFCNINAIKNAHVIAGRAEEIAHTKKRATYELVVARALSKLNVALELSAAFIKIGGSLIVPHGTSWEGELAHSSEILDSLGLDIPEPFLYSLGNVDFTAVIFKKVTDTPKEFPRPVGIPAKRPL